MKKGLIHFDYLFAIYIANNSKAIFLTQQEFNKSLNELLLADERLRFRSENYNFQRYLHIDSPSALTYIERFSKNIHKFKTDNSFIDKEARMYCIDILKLFTEDSKRIKFSYKRMDTSKDICLTLTLYNNILNKFIFSDSNKMNEITFMASDVVEITYEPMLNNHIILQIQKNIYLIEKNDFRIIDTQDNEILEAQEIVQEDNKIVPLIYDEKLSKLDELFKRTKDYTKSSNYIEALGFIVKLKNIAPYNAWLLRGQNPDITFVATANEWAEKFDRAIKTKARAYIVLRAFGPVNFVYDIKDTVGETDLPEDLQSYFRASGEIKDNYISNIENCCKKKDILINYDNSLEERSAGWASHNHLANTRAITINNEHPKEVKFSTLCHELAHLMLGHLGKFQNCECKDNRHLSEITMEIEAESVSWLVCNRLGLNTDADRYLNKLLEGTNAEHTLSNISIDNILITAGRIESMALNKICTVKKKS